MKIVYKIYKVTDGLGKDHTCVSETTARVWHFTPKTSDGQIVHMGQDLRHIESTCKDLGFEINIIEKEENV